MWRSGGRENRAHTQEAVPHVTSAGSIVASRAVVVQDAATVVTEFQETDVSGGKTPAGSQGRRPLLADTEGEEHSADALSPQDEMKRKFREALERKRARQRDASSALRGKGAGKVRGTHGPAPSRRSFRRTGEG
jgi:hypothetical protein